MMKPGGRKLNNISSRIKDLSLFFVFFLAILLVPN